MKAYPSIPYYTHKVGMPCVAFYKYDGSNLRFEWNAKSGWFKFGTRNRLFDQTDPEFGPAIQLFTETFGEKLDVMFRKVLKTASAIAFCEFFGPHSFAGQHDVKTLNSLGFKVEHNDPKQLVLFDVNIYKKGFIGPVAFHELFAHVVPTAKVLYRGPLSEEFIKQVQNGDLPVNEGVICKGGEGHNLWMCKIKTKTYLEELKKRFAEKWQFYM